MQFFGIARRSGPAATNLSRGESCKQLVVAAARCIQRPSLSEDPLGERWFLHASFLLYDAEYWPLAVSGVCAAAVASALPPREMLFAHSQAGCLGCRCWLIRRGSEGTEPKPPMDRTFSPNPVFADAR